MKAKELLQLAHSTWDGDNKTITYKVEGTFSCMIYLKLKGTPDCAILVNGERKTFDGDGNLSYNKEISQSSINCQIQIEEGESTKLKELYIYTNCNTIPPYTVTNREVDLNGAKIKFRYGETGWKTEKFNIKNGENLKSIVIDNNDEYETEPSKIEVSSLSKCARLRNFVWNFKTIECPYDADELLAKNFKLVDKYEGGDE